MDPSSLILCLSPSVCPSPPSTPPREEWQTGPWTLAEVCAQHLARPLYLVCGPNGRATELWKTSVNVCGRASLVGILTLEYFTCKVRALTGTTSGRVSVVLQETCPSCLSCWDGAPGGGASPHGLHLVLLLQEAQPSPHFVQQLRALEAAAAAVALHHHGAVAAHHHRLPGHRELLSHALAARGPVPGKDSLGPWHAASQTLGTWDSFRRGCVTQRPPGHHVPTPRRWASAANGLFKWTRGY